MKNKKIAKKYLNKYWSNISKNDPEFKSLVKILKKKDKIKRKILKPIVDESGNCGICHDYRCLGCW